MLPPFPLTFLLEWVIQNLSVSVLALWTSILVRMVVRIVVRIVAYRPEEVVTTCRHEVRAARSSCFEKSARSNLLWVLKLVLFNICKNWRRGGFLWWSIRLSVTGCVMQPSFLPNVDVWLGRGIPQRIVKSKWPCLTRDQNRQSSGDAKGNSPKISRDSSEAWEKAGGRLSYQMRAIN